MSTSASGPARAPTVFEQQREELIREIALEMENVLQNLNRLNRNLESIIAVGNEFSSVEALWSQFENFMGTNPEGGRGGDEEQQEDGENNNGVKREDGKEGHHDSQLEGDEGKESR
ncbi:hypothetical protein VTN96DRAFT_5103 [Rasamsonia emersonii]|uniref:DASH complex subunit DAD1 n=1 Tax=Rasamsonia emersonii (strain ATCC 16479 / CBS 393.64 / IMI 116815) TaxID=1408163 RepID=A0A0F4YKR7_RASE3|nr:hypothetical protein T310_7149 [Rasamsonia emersonii CBS 393.64]KKA18892.1 hypothetical protein T310_7149 [Rasamsonia emersonii CBS 393.64]